MEAGAEDEATTVWRVVGTAAAPEEVLDLQESLVLLDDTAGALVATGALEETTAGALVATGAELEVTSATALLVETTTTEEEALVAETTTAEEDALVAETTTDDEATGVEVPPVVPSQTAGPGMVYEVKLP